MNDPDALLSAAERILEVLAKHQVDALVIGAIALAAHHYVRQTEDLDLGVNAPLAKMHELTASLRSERFDAEFSEPDADDPPGGVINVRGPFGLVQVVNFADRFPAVIDDAVRAATQVVREDSALRLVPIPHLIALKLYAGGYKSKADIVELIARNPELDLDEVRHLCSRYRLSGIDELIQEAS